MEPDFSPWVQYIFTALYNWKIKFFFEFIGSNFSLQFTLLAVKSVFCVCIFIPGRLFTGYFWCLRILPMIQKWLWFYWIILELALNCLKNPVRFLVCVLVLSFLFTSRFLKKNYEQLLHHRLLLAIRYWHFPH